VLTFEFNPSVSGITPLCAEVSEVILMAAHNRWRSSYNSAFRELGDWTLQALVADFAIMVCTERMSEIVSENSPERVEIGTALDDLRILKALCRKYGQIYWTSKVSVSPISDKR
jgi:hypothetical protein